MKFKNDSNNYISPINTGNVHLIRVTSLHQREGTKPGNFEKKTYSSLDHGITTNAFTVSAKAGIRIGLRATAEDGEDAYAGGPGLGMKSERGIGDDG